MTNPVPSVKIEIVSWVLFPRLAFLNSRKVQEDRVQNTFPTQLCSLTSHNTQKVLRKPKRLGYLATERNFFFPSSFNNLVFLKICRRATLQASMTASRGFRFSVGGRVKLDTDQFCVCWKAPGWNTVFGIGSETAGAVGWKMYALALCVQPGGMFKRLWQSWIWQLSSQMIMQG